MNFFTKGLLFIFVSISANAVEIRDPLQYSIKTARDFSLGDSGKPGQYHCRHERDEELDVGGSIQIISCYGTREILVFGGYMTAARFECRFNFEPLTDDWEYWQVTYESCQ